MIANVYKLAFYSELVCERGKVFQQKNFSDSLQQESKQFDKADLMSKLRNLIISSASESPEIFMPLSGGYDSNLILKIMLDSGHSLIHTFTIGGTEGNSEIDTVKNNISGNHSIDPFFGEIGNEYFDIFSDIVWRL